MKTTKPKSEATTTPLNITYAYGYYEDSNDIFIDALKDGEFYAEVNIDLICYGIRPGPNRIIIPSYKFTKEELDTFKRDLVKRVITRINYGPFDAYGELVELKDDWKNRCDSYSSLYSPKTKTA